MKTPKIIESGENVEGRFKGSRKELAPSAAIPFVIPSAVEESLALLEPAGRYAGRIEDRPKRFRESEETQLQIPRLRSE